MRDVSPSSVVNELLKKSFTCYTDYVVENIKKGWLDPFSVLFVTLCL